MALVSDAIVLNFDNTYHRDLQGLYLPCQPAAVPAPELRYFNAELAQSVCSNAADLQTQAAQIFSGNALPSGAQPIAQAYAGHQFGHFSPQLGDGRAVLLGEVLDTHGQRQDIALKGSGRTPFSRNGDGKAALAPMLREVIVGEALHALGIPSTRALAVVQTGEWVRRERNLPGAVLTRVASSHIRVGTFEFFAARRDVANLQRLAHYAIARHDAHLLHDRPSNEPLGAAVYLAFFKAVVQRQAKLIAQWLHAGFVHGVMNTDNMAVSGQSIDFGPCAWIEAYDPQACFSSIDHQGRYAYGQQAGIAQWNLARLAECLLLLCRTADDESAVAGQAGSDETMADWQATLASFQPVHQSHWLNMARAKLGLTRTNRGANAQSADTIDDEVVKALVQDWLQLLQDQEMDYHLAWRHLANAIEHDAPALLSLAKDAQPLLAWLAHWRKLVTSDGAMPATQMALVVQSMHAVNPLYVPRNHWVEQVLAAAQTDGNFEPLNTMLHVLRSPFTAQSDWAEFALPATAQQRSGYQTFCGT